MNILNLDLCPNGCGEKGPHFVPPSLGEAGFYMCKSLTPEPPAPAPEAPYPVDAGFKALHHRFVMYPSLLLNMKCSPVTQVDADRMTPEFVKEVQKVCAYHRGYAVAGPQIGMLRRFFVMSPHSDLRTPDLPTLWVNPVVTIESPEKSYMQEGCLSIVARKSKKRFALLSRPTAVVVEHGVEGARVTTACSGLLGRVVQHEIDHLDGVLFIERLSAIDRPKIEDVLREMRKGIPAEKGR